MKNIKLIISRHGQSIWNKENKFTGWTNIGLTKKGIKKSFELSDKLINNNIIPKIIYTSDLNRSIKTCNIIKNNIIHKTKCENIEIINNWRLNERNYGIFEGMNRNKAIELYGEENINNIRNKYYYMPYISENKAVFDNNILYNNNNSTFIGESLNMIYKRLYPFWTNKILQDLLYHETLLIVSHKNTIKLLIQIIEELNDKDVENLNINNSDLIVYHFDYQMNLINKELYN